jgi:adenine-specific DNA-methyltransferase
MRPPPGRHWMWEREKAEQAVTQGILRRNPRSGRPEYKVMTDRPIIGTLWDDIPAYSFRYGFATEKSEKLISRILESSSREGDLVADFFGGSGTTCGAAERLNRRWIGCDLSKVAIQVTRTRLVQQDAKPFLIENIGNYQREMIYLSGGRIGEMQQVILKLYGATPRKDSADLGTRHSPEQGVLELVYVGYPDRPVTARKAEELARQAEKLDGTGYKRLVILAWDYDYNYSSELENRLKAARYPIRIKIESRTIPPDIYDYLKKARDENDIEPLREKIQFYEKPYLRLTKPQVKPSIEGKAEVTIGIDRYVVFDLPVAQKEREKLQELVKDNFAVLIDYWAVDWDYDGYTFKSQWQDMRGNGRKTKVITTQATTKMTTGKTYTIAVRLVDIFGNDAAGTVRVEL